MMPGDGIDHDQGSGAQPASFPCFLPRLGGRYGQNGIGSKERESWEKFEKFEGKIKVQPRRDC